MLLQQRIKNEDMAPAGAARAASPMSREPIVVGGGPIERREPTVAALAGDEPPRGVVDQLRAELGDALVDALLKPGDDLWLRVRTDAWRAGRVALRDAIGFDYFCFLSAIDWLPSPYGKGEDDPTEPPPERDDRRSARATPAATPASRCSPGCTAPSAPRRRHAQGRRPRRRAVRCRRWVPVYAGANWHERETQEMFGIAFAGHPDLRHMYLPGDFEGYPLRKDFPLLARMVKPWPGIVDVEPMPGDLDDEAEAERRGGSE